MTEIRDDEPTITALRADVAALTERVRRLEGAFDRDANRTIATLETLNAKIRGSRRDVEGGLTTPTPPPADAPDEAAKRIRVAQWLMDQFDGDRHLSASGHTVSIRNHPEQDGWFKAADDLLKLIDRLAAPADRAVVVPEDIHMAIGDALHRHLEFDDMDADAYDTMIADIALAALRAAPAGAEDGEG